MEFQEVKIISYEFLQHYWWFLVSLLGALLVFLMFVQGANSCMRSLGWTEEGKRLVVNSTGRKWELTFTTLVTFGGAFFASFPLFYSTSFGGAYWLWMIILFTFVSFGSIIILVGLTMPHYRCSMPPASPDMNLRQCCRVITPTATNSGTACFPHRRVQAS